MKKLIAGITILITLMTGLSVSAEETDLQELLNNLHTEYEELKVQVESGEITVEDAHTTWQALISEVREKKDQYFANRMERAQERIHQIIERDPERAAVVQERLNEAVQNRVQLRAKREEITDKLMNGEINLERAQQLRTEIREEVRENVDQVKERIQQRKTEMIKIKDSLFPSISNGTE